MPKETSLRFLLEEIDKSIEIIKIKAKSNKRKLKFFFFISLLFSTTTTLILAFDFVGYEKTQKNIALIFSAALTLASGWTARFDYQKLWFRQKATLLSMYQLKNKVNYLKIKLDINQLDVDELFNEYKAIWEKDSQEWSNINREYIESKTNLSVYKNDGTTPQ
ncbi:MULTISPECIES: SLATT domain-containing protein [Enterobacteriaceae]|uniref:SLATT domain-containing protein n=6 Tax=Citrobacter freundii complex TaxID=1344959 RepID=A0A9P3Z247_CITFR|nr:MULTISPECIES: SLATT domain-containing protein [Enterobacteriaceae]EIY5003688.1 SLATT domain-containing protein [Klebsiella quasipneumoniae]ELK6071488.1 SLATT domain-containing protein [Citrobacter freundii]HBQ3017514.1 SLATT domain-containing protein [Klebsiella quasipneumoniae subsp. quasipneumoniae]HEN4988365.1 SLATT domain-containing protein [Klebsiella variicola subsp. variicola]ELK6558217.1 SLATT domain-containing protein [Citrobacter freundii]